MTISSPTNKFQYTGNAVTTTFSYPNVFFAPADLSVQIVVTATGVPISPVPVLNGAATYDYTISGTLDATTGEYLSGANVIFNTAPLSTHSITLQGQVPETQSVSLIDNSKFPASAVNTALDRLTRIIQYVQDLANASVHMPATDPPGLTTVAPAVASRAGAFMAWDASGNVIASTAAVGSTAVTAYMQTVLGALTAAQARSLLVAAGLTDNQNFTGFNTFNTPTANNASSNVVATALYVDRALANIVVRTQSFLVTGTYTPNANLLYGEAEGVGGGGGGASAASGAGAYVQGGGGGSGAYSRSFFTAASIGASRAVTIGVGGVGGPSGASSGGAGSDTIMAGILTAKAGSGGGVGTAGSPVAAGGAGGLASGGVGDFKLSGQGGGAGMIGTTVSAIAIPAGYGAPSVWGGGACTVPNLSAAVAGVAGQPGTGAGGSAAWTGNAANAAGGAGGTGQLVVTEYCKA